MTNRRLGLYLNSKKKNNILSDAISNARKMNPKLGLKMNIKKLVILAISFIFSVTFF